MIEKLVDVQNLVEAVEKEVVEWRRHFHENPELSFQEFETSNYVFDKLQSFGNIEVSRVTPTSVLGRIVCRQPGKVIALRADMDALPILEETGLPFASKNKDVMHACGHDGHTAMLLGAAKVLSQLKDELKGEIRFFFQHAEEQFPGGASEMVKAGVTEGIDGVIGLHLASQIPAGKFFVCNGPVTAGTDAFDIEIQGKGGHGSSPNATVDPIAIGTQIVNGINQIISRKVDASKRAVISVTKFHGGTANNIIPDRVTLGGTVRTFDPEIRSQIPIWIEQITKGLTEAHDASYQLDYQLGYSSVVNEEKITSLVEQTIVETFGENNRVIAQAIMGGEDFSAFSAEAPGCFVFLGAGSEKPEENYPHHHPKFDVKEETLILGVNYYVRSALKFLDEK
ncbi:peptidase M20D family protein [Neobacillus bataviensis LMG 21833]|uniref:Peptidase M20D family protein n=1 Tax=Neobacillus bataviensis LMG 21833 TaxID=1117379 RepID=K6E355_9BACI|nr:amidohydrolase [Neobacillus bataviensis]EKN67641.1 peptidase M20D family protein [Neobacillus bataviensis LMG 21833]